MGVHHRYYRLATGRWTGTWSFRIARPGRFLVSRMALGDRVRLVALDLADRLLGPADLITEVRVTGSPDLVEHTAWLRRFGLTLYRADRRFRLCGDDALDVEGVEASWPSLGRARSLARGSGRVLDPSHADYTLPMGGITWHVGFVVGHRHAWSTVETPWATGTERLIRARPPEP